MKGIRKEKGQNVSMEEEQEKEYRTVAVKEAWKEKDKNVSSKKKERELQLGGRLWIAFSVAVIITLFIVVITHYDRTFASNRGYIWSYAVETFRQSTFIRKLFGWGPDCFKYALYSMVGENIAATWPEANWIANAHNEVIQYLVTMGAFGMAAYLTIYAAALASVKNKHDILCMAAKASVFAYFCTALGNNPQGLNYGILFIMLAVINRRSAQN